MRYSTTRPLAPTEAHGCEQLAQSCYSTMRRSGVEPATSPLQVQHFTATLPTTSTVRRPGVEPATSRLQVQHFTATLPSHPITIITNIIIIIN